MLWTVLVVVVLEVLLEPEVVTLALLQISALNVHQHIMIGRIPVRWQSNLQRPQANGDL